MTVEACKKAEQRIIHYSKVTDSTTCAPNQIFFQQWTGLEFQLKGGWYWAQEKYGYVLIRGEWIFCKMNRYFGRSACRHQAKPTKMPQESTSDGTDREDSVSSQSGGRKSRKGGLLLGWLCGWLNVWLCGWLCGWLNDKMAGCGMAGCVDGWIHWCTAGW